MLDEFPSLGKLDILQESLAFLPGYGIKAYLIAQDINQLYAHYGRDEAITSTCHVQCTFAPNRIETAEHLSKLTGQTTVGKEQVTTSGSGWSTNVSRSTHEVSRPLLTPDEAMRMKGARKNAQGMITEPGNMVIYVAGYPAIMGLQPLYFRDFRARPPRQDYRRSRHKRKNSGTCWLTPAYKNARKEKAGFHGGSLRGALSHCAPSTVDLCGCRRRRIKVQAAA
jgi:type IV secretory pathway TraG/TraD family ATPase VirD4